MKLELKRINFVDKGENPPSPCYKATLYKDHIHAAEIRNDGKGDPDKVTWIKPELQPEIDAYFEGMTKLDLSSVGGDKDTPWTLELWCHEQVHDYAMRRDFKSLIKRKVVVAAEGMLQELNDKPEKLKAVGNKPYRDSLAKKYGEDVVILNDLDFEVAYQIYQDPRLTPEDIGPEVAHVSDKPEPVKGFDEATEAELKRQTNRPKMERPVEGETDEEREARIKRNDELLGEQDPELADDIRRAAARAKDVNWADHPGAKLKNPPDAKRREPKRKEIAAGSLRDRLIKAGIKPIQHRVRQQVARLICETEGGVSTAELAQHTGASAHDIGNHIYYLKWENGYDIQHRMEGRTRKYIGKPPAVEAKPGEPEANGEEDAA